MKTSNKLLITLALIAFLVPVAFSFYQSQYYVKANWEQSSEKALFSEEMIGFTKKKVSAFTSVQLSGSDITFHITIVKDEEFGIRFLTNSSDRVAAEVKDGVLTLTGKNKENKHNSSFEIMVYAPNVQSITGIDIDAMFVSGNQQALNIVGKSLSRIELGDRSKFANISIKADSVQRIKINASTIQTLSADLIASNFATDKVSYRSLEISTTNGDVMLGEEDSYNKPDAKEKKAFIEWLNLRTLGRGTVSINMDVQRLSGSLSDSSKVNMPVSFLKQFALPAPASYPNKSLQTKK